MITVINYANERYRKTQRFNTWTAKHIGGADYVEEFSPKDIDLDFKKENISILSEKRGNGLWLWKPYFIYRVLTEMQDGDILFYSDSGAFFISSIKGIIKSMGSDDIWLYGLPFEEWQFTKDKVFHALYADEDDYKHTNQFSGTFMAFKAGQKSREFVREWLSCCCNYDLISPSTEDEVEGFISHREDQSIISILAKKHKLKMHKDPSQYGKLPEKYIRDKCIYKPVDCDDSYGVTLIHHRTANVAFQVCAKQIISVILPRFVSLKLLNTNSQRKAEQ